MSVLILWNDELKALMELKPELGSVILDDLRSKFPEIPERGVLAGGAVADWFFGLAPNDIDVFVPATWHDIEKSKNGVTTAVFGQPEAEFNEYEGVNCIAWKQLYKVVSSRRQGMINLITCRGENLTAARIISGFDLNATRIGIDLDTKRLVWDEDFAHFLKNRRLRVSAMFTPAHTAIRYFHKKNRLQCAGDDDVEMELLSEAWNNDRMGRSDYQLVPQFGRVHLEKAIKANELGLDRYFSIEGMGYFWTLSPKFKSDFKTFGLDGVIFPVHAPKALRDQRMNAPKSMDKKVNEIRSLSDSKLVLSLLEMFGGGYVRGQVSERSIREVSSFFNDRPDFLPLLMGAHHERQHLIVKRLARFSEHYGSWIYGLTKHEATLLDVISEDAFKVFVAKFEDQYSQKLNEIEIDAPCNFLWYSIERILTTKALVTQAEKLRSTTCYFRGKKSNVLSFSIKSRLSGREMSTAHVENSYFGHYSLECVFRVQALQSYRDTAASLGCKLASFWIISTLNAKSFTEKFSIFIDLCKQENFIGRLKHKVMSLFQPAQRSPDVTPNEM